MSDERQTPEGCEQDQAVRSPTVCECGVAFNPDCPNPVHRRRHQAGPEHPVDALERLVLRPTAERLGLEVDEEALAAARAHCDELVPAPPPFELGPPARAGDWIQTFTGRQYWPLDPRADEVEIEDIAHHLSMLCRFTGACDCFYSVAEHSVHVSFVVQAATLAAVDEGLRMTIRDRRLLWLRALLHDASEAYCNDIARPVKRSIIGYDEIERANERAIAERFGLAGNVPQHAALIKQADNAMLLAEQAVLMKPPPGTWAPVEVPPAMVATARARLEAPGRPRTGWGPERAERVFKGRFLELAT